MDEHTAKEMHRQLDKWTKHADLLDVGSLSVNGHFRFMVLKHGWSYTGLDIKSGPNVDIVTEDPYNYPFEDESFDIVIAGSTMEHVEAIWLWVPELTRVLRKDGFLVILTHTDWVYHPFPVDCWRIMPDGMRYLFDQTGVLHDYDINMFAKGHIVGAARKR